MAIRYCLRIYMSDALHIHVHFTRGTAYVRKLLITDNRNGTKEASYRIAAVGRLAVSYSPPAADFVSLGQCFWPNGFGNLCSVWLVQSYSKGPRTALLEADLVCWRWVNQRYRRKQWSYSTFSICFVTTACSFCCIAWKRVLDGRWSSSVGSGDGLGA